MVKTEVVSQGCKQSQVHPRLLHPPHSTPTSRSHRGSAHGSEPAVTADMSSPGFPRRVTVPPIPFRQPMTLPPRPLGPASQLSCKPVRAWRCQPRDTTDRPSWHRTRASVELKKYTWPGCQKENPMNNPKFIQLLCPPTYLLSAGLWESLVFKNHCSAKKPQS